MANMQHLRIIAPDVANNIPVGRYHGQAGADRLRLGVVRWVLGILSVKILLIGARQWAYPPLEQGGFSSGSEMIQKRRSGFSRRWVGE